MGQIEVYRQIIMDLLKEYSSYSQPNDTIASQVIFDTERNHYQLLGIGWQGERRVLHPSIHIDIIGDKVWLQHDMTDAVIADELVERGIPKSQIVLGFHPEHVRHYTGFAIC